MLQPSTRTLRLATDQGETMSYATSLPPTSRRSRRRTPRGLMLATLAVAATTAVTVSVMDLHIDRPGTSTVEPVPPTATDTVRRTAPPVAAPVGTGVSRSTRTPSEVAATRRAVAHGLLPAAASVDRDVLLTQWTVARGVVPAAALRHAHDTATRGAVARGQVPPQTLGAGR